MNISVFGIGYVGAVTAACFAADGHKVIGVDVNRDKVRSINEGRSPIIERSLDELTREAVRSGNLSATDNVAEAVNHAEVCIICVGTPSAPNGNLNFEYVERVCTQIGQALAKADGYKVLAMRSTMLPGTLLKRLIPILERESGKKVGVGFGAAVNPEFLREGSAIEDFRNPPFTVIGQVDERGGDILAKLYADIPAPIFRVAPDEASMIKYACNAFHALKVVFANEIGRLGKELGIDSTKVMDVFCQDTRLNISPRYLKPGFAFGGSCLPKDLRALTYLARHSDVDLPMMDSLMPSNERHVQFAYRMIERLGKKRVTLAGLSFKPGTDDLRESPMVHLAETLLGKGYDVRIYDRNVNLSRLVGSNRAYIEQAIPHIAALMCDTLEDAVRGADVVIASHGINSELAGVLRAGQTVIDLARTATDSVQIAAEVEGICW